MTISVNRAKKVTAHINNEKKSIVIKAGGTKETALSVVAIAETIRRVMPTPVQVPKSAGQRCQRYRGGDGDIDSPTQPR